MVFFFCHCSRKDFGVIVGTEKEDYFKVYDVICVLHFMLVLNAFCFMPDFERGFRRTSSGDR